MVYNILVSYHCVKLYVMLAGVNVSLNFISLTIDSKFSKCDADWSFKRIFVLVFIHEQYQKSYFLQGEKN